MLRILYLGLSGGSSRHRAEALRRLKHKVELIDPWESFPHVDLVRKCIGKFVYEVGAGALEPYVRHRVLKKISRHSYDLVWVDGGELFGSSTVSQLREVAPLVINYNIDDPFGTRDRRRFFLYRRAVPLYDLLVVVREPNVAEACAVGARRVLRVFMSADEVAHTPIAMTADERVQWASDVIFIGTWMPERGPFLIRLLELGVPLTIYGNRWNKAREWNVLKDTWAGPGLDGKDYVKAIQCAKVCLGLLSKGNRDEHTQRSVEIPYTGGVLCAERTKEHLYMYDEDKEAVFWSTPEECATKCKRLLGDDNLRIRIARAGQARCEKNGFLNERVVADILGTALGRADYRRSKLMPEARSADEP